MSSSPSSSSRQGNPRPPIEPPELTHAEKLAAGVGRNRNRLGSAPSGRDFCFVATSCDLGQRAPGPTPDAGPVVAVDDTIEKLRALTELLRGEHPVRLPRAKPFPPPPDPPPPELRAASSNKAVLKRLAIHPEQRWPTILHRPTSSLLERMAFPFSSALVILLCAGFVATNWPPATKAVSDAPSGPPVETRRATLASSPQTGPTSTEFDGPTVNAGGDEPPIIIQSDGKPTGNEIEAELSPTFSAGERSTAAGAMGAVPVSGPTDQLPQEGGATEVLDLQTTRPNTEAEEQSPAGLTCYASALAVRQNAPDAWPSWTLHAPGHEGTRCWHATTRASVHDRRAELPPKRQKVGSLGAVGSPTGEAH
jgi:hypothetical protein